MAEGWQRPMTNNQQTPTATAAEARGRLTKWLVVGIVIGVAVLLRAYVYESDIVEGNSMRPRLRSGDCALVYKLAYRGRPPQRFDVITFRAPGSNQVLIKRVVGLPGEWVWIWGSQVLVDGGRLEEPYAARWRGEYTAPVWVGPDSVYVLGDNRDVSEDSRTWGPVPLSSVRGKAVVVYFPFNRIHWVR